MAREISDWAKFKRSTKSKLNKVFKKSKWNKGSFMLGSSGELLYEDEYSVWFFYYSICEWRSETIDFKLAHLSKSTLESIFQLFPEKENEVAIDYLREKKNIWQIWPVQLEEWKKSLSIRDVEDVVITAFNRCDKLIKEYNRDIRNLTTYKDFYYSLPMSAEFSNEETYKVIGLTDLLIRKDWQKSYDYMKSFEYLPNLKLQRNWLGDQTQRLMLDLLSDKVGELQKLVVVVKGDISRKLSDFIEICYGDSILSKVKGNNVEVPEVMHYEATVKWTYFDDTKLDFIDKLNLFKEVSRELKTEVNIFKVDNNKSLYEYHCFGEENISFVKSKDEIYGSNLTANYTKYLNKDTDFSSLFQLAITEGIELYRQGYLD